MNQGTAGFYVNAHTQILLLQTARAIVYRPDQSQSTVNARILFDSGSQRTFITKTLKELQLPVLNSEQLMIKTFGTNDEQLRTCDSGQLTEKPSDESMSIYLNAHTVDTICSPTVNQPVNFAVRNYKHLHDLKLAENVTTENSSEEIEVLIENDQMWNFFTGNVILGQNGPVAMETFLGYVLSGTIYNVLAENTINLVSSHTLRINVSNVTQENCKTFGTQENCKDLDAKTKPFFDLETLGITPNEASVHEHFKDEIKFVNNHYEVKLPFKEGNDLLPDNYMLIFKQIKESFKTIEE